MAGETIVVQLPFTGGLDEKVAKEYLDPSTRLLSVVNGDFVKVGAIDKRVGFEHLSTTIVPGGTLPALTSGTRALGWSRSSLSLLCSTGLYHYSDAHSGVIGVASLPDVACVRRPVTTSPTETTPTLLDLPYGDTTLRICIFWDASYNLLAGVYDAETGDAVLEPETIFTCTGTFGGGTIPIPIAAFYLPNAATVAQRTNIIVQNLADQKVYAIQYSPATNAFAAASLLFTGIAAQGVDAAPYVDDPAGGFIVVRNTSTTNVRLHYYHPDLTEQATQNYTVNGGTTIRTPLYVVPTYGEAVWLLWTTYDGAANYEQWGTRATPDYAFTQSATASIYSTTTRSFLGGGVRLSASRVFLEYHQSVTTGPPGSQAYRGRWAWLEYSAGSVLPLATGACPFGFFPVTKPFVVDGAVYQAFYLNPYMTAASTASDTKSLQVTGYLCRYRGISATSAGGTPTNVCMPVVTFAPRQIVHSTQLLTDFFTLFHRGTVSTTDPDATRVAIGIKTMAPDISASAGEKGVSWAVDFLWDTASRRQLYQASELGTELSISSGVPFVADGETAYEDSFFAYPEFAYVTTGGAGCALTGTFNYAVVYRYSDAAGLVHRSAPYFAGSITLPDATKGGIVHFPPCPVSWRDVTNPGEIQCDVYRTTSDGSVFYFLGSVANDPTATDLTYPASGIDNVSDTTLGSATLLYTTGGLLDNVNPPSSSIQIVHKNRKAIVDETLRSVWFSKEFKAGEAPGFNEALIVPFPDGGDITALASMDGKFVAFKVSSIWIMIGDGPSDTGQGSDWTQPEAICSDVGAVSWQSVVNTPKGVFFQAPNGIYLLGRDLQVSFVGKAVVDRTTAYPVVTSSCLVPGSTQVRFTCSNEAGTDAIVIVYDYLLDQWTTHTYARLSAPIASACLTFNAPRRYTLLTTDGKLWQERLPGDANRYKDQDSSGVEHFVPTTCALAWVKTQVQGFQRMRRAQFFGEQQDDCGLQATFAFNYDDTARQTATWYSHELAALENSLPVEAYVAAAWNKQMAIQISFTDVAGSSMTTGQGMRFVAAALELQNLGPRYRLLAAGARR